MSGDPWPFLIFGGAVLLILFMAWRGWRLGVVRQVVGLLALAAAWVCGIFGGRLAAPFVRAVWPGPELVVVGIGGLLLGFVVLGFITVVSAVLFKKTEHQSVGFVRFGYGVAGAAVGAFSGMVLLWMTLLGIRLLGSVAEAQLAVEQSPRFRANQPPGKVAPSSSLARGLANLKHAIDQGAAGPVIQQVDPVPNVVHATLGKLGRVASDAKSAERFMAYPGVRPILAQPKVAALLTDPEINRAATGGHYFTMLTNPRLVAAADDPEVAAMLRKFEFEKALDHALAGRSQ